MTPWQTSRLYIVSWRHKHGNKWDNQIFCGWKFVMLEMSTTPMLRYRSIVLTLPWPCGFRGDCDRKCEHEWMEKRKEKTALLKHKVTKLKVRDLFINKLMKHNRKDFYSFQCQRARLSCSLRPRPPSLAAVHFLHIPSFSPPSLSFSLVSRASRAE